MAIDNLNVMTSWLPAGQQTDQYSTKPWCLRSKNLDIFSSSKSAKGTAWSEETQEGSDIIKQVWVLTLKTDWKVYEWDRVIAIPWQNLPPVDIKQWRWWPAAPMTRWTPKDMTVKYWDDGWETFTVFTDRASYTYNKKWFIYDKTFVDVQYFTPYQNKYEKRNFGYHYSDWWWWEWYMFTKTNNETSWWTIRMNVFPWNLWKGKMVIWANNRNNPEYANAFPYINVIEIWNMQYYYDAQVGSFMSYYSWHTAIHPSSENNLITEPYFLDFDALPNTERADFYLIDINIVFRKKEWASDNKRNGNLIIDIMWWPEKDYRADRMFWKDWETYIDGQDTAHEIYYDCLDWYNLLPRDRQRELKKIWEYYWMKGKTVQTLYYYNESWIENNSNREKEPYYTFEQYMTRDNPTTMDVIDMISWNEKIYMIGNMDGNGYIIPCELTGWKGTPYIAYGCTFKGATNIDYLMYLVGEDRGISQLWCYNTQELVPLIWGDKKKVEVDSVTHEKADNDFIDTNEQYRFNWKMVEYRGDLVLATEDNRLFRYGQTAGGKGWSFIFDIPWEITDLRTENDNLIVSYEVTRTETDENEQEVEVTYKYNRTYQDDIADKNYLTEREAVYPIALWNHLLEKEESDLYTSYILPSKDCKLEFWGAWNHYHYRTFKVWNVVPWSWVSPSVALELLRTWKLQIAGTTWAYNLEYVEDDGTRFTYRLVGDLPQQTENSIKQLTKATTNHNDDPFYTFTEFHHFRKIGEITAEGYTEGEYRFHNLNNKLELPKTHSLQIMVKGTWTAEASPELFTVDLIANQRERW